MKTQPTLNSVNFKYVKCPACLDNPDTQQFERKAMINFRGFRWNFGDCSLEIQGSCGRCFKEWRIKISNYQPFENDIDILNPKKGPSEKKVGDIENFLRR